MITKLYPTSVLRPFFAGMSLDEEREMKAAFNAAFLHELYLYDDKVTVVFCGQRTYKIPRKIKTVSDFTKWICSKSDF